MAGAALGMMVHRTLLRSGRSHSALGCDRPGRSKSKYPARAQQIPKSSNLYRRGGDGSSPQLLMMRLSTGDEPSPPVFESSLHHFLLIHSWTIQIFKGGV